MESNEVCGAKSTNAERKKRDLLLSSHHVFWRPHHSGLVMSDTTQTVKKQHWILTSYAGSRLRRPDEAGPPAPSNGRVSTEADTFEWEH